MRMLTSTGGTRRLGIGSTTRPSFSRWIWSWMSLDSTSSVALGICDTSRARRYADPEVAVSIAAIDGERRSSSRSSTRTTDRRVRRFLDYWMFKHLFMLCHMPRCFRLKLQRRLVRPHSFPVRPRLLQRHQVHRFLDRPYHDRGIQAHLEQVLEKDEHDQREGLWERRYARYDRERERDEVSLDSQHEMMTRW